MWRSGFTLLDEIKLNRFLSLDWGKIEADLKKVDQEIELLEKLAATVDAISEVLGLFYEERYGAKKPDLRLWDLEKEPKRNGRGF